MLLSKKPSRNSLKKKFLLLIVLAKILFVFYLIHNNIPQSLLQSFVVKYSNDFKFILNNITTNSQGDYCINLDEDPYLVSYYHKPTILLPIKDIRRYINSIDCVSNANIKIVLPDQMIVDIQTKKVIAIWQNNRRFSFITDKGDTIKIRSSEGLDKFIIITGKDAPQYAPKLLKIITSDQDVLSQIASAIWVGNRRWDIRFINGAEVMLPEHNVDLAWNKFLNIYKNKAEFSNWKYNKIDLRIENRVYAK